MMLKCFYTSLAPTLKSLKSLNPLFHFAFPLSLPPLTPSRLPRRRVPYSISRSAHLPTWPLPWLQHLNLGRDPGPTRRLFLLRLSLRSPHSPRRLRILRGAHPRANNSHVVPKI